VGISGSDSEPGGEPPQVAQAGPNAGELWPAARDRIVAHVIAALVLTTGLWVATSPRFLTLMNGHASTAGDVIIGLAVAGISMLALVGRRGLAGLQFTSLVLGVWAVLITSFMLDAERSGAAAWYWSNTWSGAVLAVLALAELSALRHATH
jgi:hypothetical protein